MTHQVSIGLATHRIGPSQEVSYRCFCACGGLLNPRFWTKSIVNRRGEHLRTAYMDAGHGPLSAKP